jgi:hypothetical protein
MLYKNCCFDDLILSFIKLNTQQDTRTYNKNELRLRLHVASNDMMLVNYELERIGKEEAAA